MSLSRLLPAAPIWRHLRPLSGASLLAAFPSARQPLLLHTRCLSTTLTRPSVDKGPPKESFFIPEPPASPEASLPDLTSPVLNHLGEPTFASLDLGTSYFPSDFFLKFFEMLHVTAEMPWWMAIGVATLTVRVALFPLIVYHRKKNIHFQNNMPTMKKLQDRLQKAQMQNNVLEMMHVQREMQSFAERNEMTSVKNLFILPGINIFVLLSCLHALRSMANYPVASLQEGGLFWFTDLSLTDPYFALPAICCGTMYLIFRVGADMTKMTTASPAMRYVMTGFPILGFFFIMNMPAAVTYYFTVANCVSLVQTAVMKLPSVQKALKIPMEVQHKPEETEKSPGVLRSFKDNANRAKILRQVQERERLDDERFRAAGKAPIEKTRPAAAPKQKSGDRRELRKA